MAQNISANASAQPAINLTCMNVRCTNLVIEVINKTFVPSFYWKLLESNCTFSPFQTGALDTSGHYLNCFFPAKTFNFTSQKDFEEGTLPMTIFLQRRLENLTVDFADYEKKKAELPFWQVMTILLIIGVIGYIIWQKYDESSGDE